MNVGNINKVGFDEAGVVSAKKNNAKSLKKNEISIKPIKNNLSMVELGNEKAASADSKICNKKINQRKSVRANLTLKKNTNKEEVSSSVESSPGSYSVEESKKSKTQQTKAQKETSAKEINLLNSNVEDLDNSQREKFARKLLDVIDRRFLEYREKREKMVLHMQEGIKIFKDLRASEKVVLEAKSALIEAQRDYKARSNQLDQNVAISKKTFDEATDERSKEISNLSKVEYDLNCLKQEIEELKRLLEKKEPEAIRLSDIWAKEQVNLYEQAKKIKLQELQNKFKLAEENLKKAKDARDAAKSSLDFALAKSSSNTANEGEFDIFVFDDFWDESLATVFGSYADTSADSDFVAAQNNYDTAQQNYDRTYGCFNELKSAMDKANQFLRPYTVSCRKAKFALENAQKNCDEAKMAYEHKQNIDKEKYSELSKALKEAKDHYDKNFPTLDKKFHDAGKNFWLAEKERDEVKKKISLKEEKLNECYEDYCYHKHRKNIFFENLRKDLLDVQKTIPNVVIKQKSGEIAGISTELSQIVISAIDDKVFDKNLIKFLKIRQNNICETEKKLCNEFNKLVENLSEGGLKFGNEILNFADVGPLLEKYLDIVIHAFEMAFVPQPLPGHAEITGKNGVITKAGSAKKERTVKDFVIEQVKWYQEKAKSACTEGFRQVCMSGPAKVVFANLFEPEIPNFYLSSEEIRQMGLDVEDVGN